jgi:hypothetical protein
MVLQFMGIDSHAGEAQILASLFALYTEMQSQPLL